MSTEQTAPAPEAASQEKPSEEPAQPRLVDVDISDENTALNVMVGFLNLAQRKGAFGFDESAKIWECINKFQRSSPPESVDSENVKVEVNESS